MPLIMSHLEQWSTFVFWYSQLRDLMQTVTEYTHPMLKSKFFVHSIQPNQTNLKLRSRVCKVRPEFLMWRHPYFLLLSCSSFSQDFHFYSISGVYFFHPGFDPILSVYFRDYVCKQTLSAYASWSSGSSQLMGSLFIYRAHLNTAFWACRRSC